MKQLFLLSLMLFLFGSLKAQTFDVQHYELNVYVPNSYQKYIEGQAVVSIKILSNNVNAIDLMLQSLTCDSVKLSNQNLTFIHNDTILQIQLDQGYNTNDLIDVEVYYHGYGQEDPSGWGGYYSSLGVAYNMGVSMSESPHGYGRIWFPCIDNFTDKATYNFNIRCQEARTAVCGGTLINEVNNGDGTKTYSWLLDKEIPTYLASVAVGNFQVYRDTFDGINGQIPVAIYARSEEFPDVPASFAHLEDAFNTLEEKYGAYRWSRVGYVCVPFNGGAMEHAENIGYPNFAVDGTDDYATLYAHELSHHWFGNLVTCSTAGDMWLNEGWANYYEAVFTEAVEGYEAMKNYNRAIHRDNIQYLNYNEGGYYALYNIPDELTYSSHVYEKGHDVVHTLRNYLGDSTFFAAITTYLNLFEYQAVSSFDLRDFLSANTNYNLNDFFDAWVFETGWPHFAIDSFHVSNNATEFDVEVAMRQRMKGRDSFANSNRIPIQFLGANFERIDTVITFDGETGSQSFTIPFEPISVSCDMEEQVADATTDYYSTISSTGLTIYSNALFKSNVTQVDGSALLRVEQHWVGPGEMETPIDPNLYIHPTRYWTVSGVWNENFIADAEFMYSKTSSVHLDNEFVTTHVDSIVVLYRENAAHPWQIIPHIRSGSTYSGYMIVNQIQRGDYAFAIWDHHVGESSIESEEDVWQIFPNPGSDFIRVESSKTQKKIDEIDILSTDGKLIDHYRFDQKNSVQINIETLSKGVYWLAISSEGSITLKKLLKSN
ncbi:MAG: T9SS type A sorting domain-containing protein [Bacteroidales bacterium]|nr:T9SS type A sorting domain-containing protein [Bacteroidales bacterium]